MPAAATHIIYGIIQMPKLAHRLLNCILYCLGVAHVELDGEAFGA